jgi:hypothetical protein
MLVALLRPASSEAGIGRVSVGVSGPADAINCVRNETDTPVHVL